MLHNYLTNIARNPPPTQARRSSATTTTSTPPLLQPPPGGLRAQQERGFQPGGRDLQAVAAGSGDAGGAEYLGGGGVAGAYLLPVRAGEGSDGQHGTVLLHGCGGLRDVRALPHPQRTPLPTQYVLSLSSNIALNIKLYLQNTFMRAVFASRSFSPSAKYMDADLIAEAFYYIPYLITSQIIIIGDLVFVFLQVGGLWMNCARHLHHRIRCDWGLCEGGLCDPA
jgi:hypothetical protein